MAKETPSQAAAIRQAWEKLGKDASAKEIVARVDSQYPKMRLGKKAHAATMVSIEKSKLFGKRRRKMVRRKKPGRARPASATRNGDLAAAVEFVQQVGGLSKAKALLGTIELIAGLS